MRSVMRPPNRKVPAAGACEIARALEHRLVGQPDAVASIVPYIRMHQAGLTPEGRPVGVFLLLGPTGTGKTRTVESLAEVLHGSAKQMVKVDCGEFQMEHEVAKLVGAPPGYLGHRETQPMLTQAKLSAAASESCDLTLVLLDEIEKAAPSMNRLLLGILDKAHLRLGDNSTVNFERTLIFLTSNLGAQAMQDEIRPSFGFSGMVPHQAGDQTRKLEQIGLSAVRRRFSPEFINRIDKIVTYKPLTNDDLSKILEQQLEGLQWHIGRRMGTRAFTLVVHPAAKRWLLKKGASREYGARELKRTIQRYVIQPLAELVNLRQTVPGGAVHVESRNGNLGVYVEV